jgi:hypothetical protein
VFIGKKLPAQQPIPEMFRKSFGPRAITNPVKPAFIDASSWDSGDASLPI